MEAGKTERWDCDDCGTEFEVTYEPKAKDSPREAENIEPKEVTVCPFCGSDIDLQDE